MIHITCAPEFDLNEASLDVAEADDFFAAWKSAAEQIAEAVGLDVRVTRVQHGSPDAANTSHGDGEGASLELVLWQEAHDRCVRGDDGWKALSPSAATVRSIRRYAEQLGLLQPIEQRAAAEADRP